MTNANAHSVRSEEKANLAHSVRSEEEVSLEIGGQHSGGGAHRAPRLCGERSCGNSSPATASRSHRTHRILGAPHRCHLTLLSATLAIVLALCSTAEGDRRVMAFIPAGGLRHAHLRYKTGMIQRLSPLGTLRPVARDLVGGGLRAQLPNHRGAERRRTHIGREVHEILRLPTEDLQGHKFCTALSASTFSGGTRTDGDDFYYPEGSTRFVAECDLPTDRGNFRLRAYNYRGAKVVVRDGENVLEWNEMDPVIIYKGNLRGNTKTVVRVHDQCYTSEVLGSKRCDCREQLELALDYINQHGGALIYMPQEGRGIGLANKIAAYQLQDGGLDTVDANRALGFGDDERDYACVPFMLNDMGIKGIRLMTNNPFKIRQLTELGVNIVGAKAHVIASNDFNAKYLRTKAARMAHALPDMESAVGDDVLDTLALSSQARDAKLAAAALDVRWRFGKKSVETAVKAVAAGSVVLMVDGSAHNKGWLVASAAAISTGSLGLMNRFGDSVSVPLAQESVEAIESHWSDCSATYEGCEAPSAPRGVLDVRADYLRRLAAAAVVATNAKASSVLDMLPPPLAAVLKERDTISTTDPCERTSATSAPHACKTWNNIQDDCIAQRLLPVRSKKDALLLPARSPCDAAVELARMARQAPVAVMSPLLDEQRLDSMSFAQVSLSLSLFLSFFACTRAARESACALALNRLLSLFVFLALLLSCVCSFYAPFFLSMSSSDLLVYISFLMRACMPSRSLCARARARALSLHLFLLLGLSLACSFWSFLSTVLHPFPLALTFHDLTFARSHPHYQQNSLSGAISPLFLSRPFSRILPCFLFLVSLAPLSLFLYLSPAPSLRAHACATLLFQVCAVLIGECMCLCKDIEICTHI